MKFLLVLLVIVGCGPIPTTSNILPEETVNAASTSRHTYYKYSLNGKRYCVRSGANESSQIPCEYFDSITNQ